MPVMAPGPSAPSLMAVWVRVPAVYQEAQTPLHWGSAGGQDSLLGDLLVLHVQSQRPCGNNRSASGTSPTKLAQDCGRNSLDPGKGCRPGQRSPRGSPCPPGLSPYLVGRRVCGPDVSKTEMGLQPEGDLTYCPSFERQAGVTLRG